MATTLLYPAFAQVLITLFLCLWMGRLRLGEIRKGDVSAKDVAARTANWSDKTRRVELSFYNQFQVPMLFFTGCLFAILMGQADYFTALFAWIFILLRLIQIYAHTVTNNIRLRFRAFVGGLVAVLVLWIYMVFNVTVSLSA